MSKTWNSSINIDSKRVDPPEPTQRDQQGLLRVGEQQACGLRLASLRCVAVERHLADPT
ncbi:hypothetical protein H257_13008 [Aphanomyces astaci]|uniref:Uncharacterized protein n=1 Tax=Aphanomyces astaci TaxID=112090 RepID=W4FYJ1_APHAT|nr:hypothetical protein H257_13008 [Aphanomyces astaci]ETV71874.1 hypothetical protein H257_13008 [Aphanomyces astaci]|eukprot:XP_009838723.1 hypothetical protein H257_13008 [Aphanomyces astaci]